jgi:aspartate aminotransferase
MSSHHVTTLRASVPFLPWMTASRFAARTAELAKLPESERPLIADLMFGNPQDLAFPSYVRALGDQLPPKNPAWFAYKTSEPEATQTVAASLAARTGMPFQAEDVAMTNGGFAAIAVALRTLCEPGDEIVFLSPPWFFYELLILTTGAVPVRVKLTPPAFDLDVGAIEAVLGPRTRAVLINSPHNPSGRVWSTADLERLARALDLASARAGHPVWIFSDEAYAKVTFDGRRAPSPAEVYPHTLVLYSYGKQLLAPGQRIGYAALPPTLPEAERAELRADIMMAQCATGFAFPNALLQHALPELDHLTIDLDALARRRDLVVSTLRGLGYEVTNPEATFYVLVRGRLGEDALVDALADHDTFVLPGSIVELPGWIRLSLTASDAMIAKALDAFRAIAHH